MSSGNCSTVGGLLGVPWLQARSLGTTTPDVHREGHWVGRAPCELRPGFHAPQWQQRQEAGGHFSGAKVSCSPRGDTGHFPTWLPSVGPGSVHGEVPGELYPGGDSGAVSTESPGWVGAEPLRRAPGYQGLVGGSWPGAFPNTLARPQPGRRGRRWMLLWSLSKDEIVCVCFYG